MKYNEKSKQLPKAKKVITETPTKKYPKYYIAYWSRSGIVLKEGRRQGWFRDAIPTIYLNRFYYYFDGKHYYEFFTKERLHEECSIFVTKMVVKNSYFYTEIRGSESSDYKEYSASEFQKSVDEYISKYGFDFIKNKIQNKIDESRAKYELDMQNKPKEDDVELWVEDYINNK